jgi:hypothetical protein
MPFNETFLDECQLAHQAPGEAYSVRESLIAIVLQYLERALFPPTTGRQAGGDVDF